MNTKYLLTVFALAALSLGRVSAQNSAGATTTDSPFSPDVLMLFSSKQYPAANSFSGLVLMEFQQQDQYQSVAGKVAYDDGKTLFQADLEHMNGAGAPTPEIKAQVRLLGLDGMTIVTRPDTNLKYQIYPIFKAYLEQRYNGNPRVPADLKVEVTPQDREKVDDQDCVKNIVKLSSKSGSFVQVYTIWNSVNQKNFPLRIQYLHDTVVVTLTFKNITVAEPDPAVFAPPPDAKKYFDQQTMILAAMAAAQPALSRTAAGTGTTAPAPASRGTTAAP